MDPSTARPPKPQLAFRVGVVGHRWDRLAQGHLARCAELELSLGATVRRILDDIKRQLEAVGQDPANGYADGPELSVVSGLAEGADRIVANAGLDAGYRLSAVLPFEAGRYSKDFDGRWQDPMWSRPHALADFERLLGRASTTVVTDGKPDRFNAYEALGHSVVNHADILIAIWDGESGRGPGGTVDLLTVARRDEIPIVRIDPTHPGAAWLEDLRDPDQGAEKGVTRLERRIADLVLPPEAAGLASAAAGKARLAFFGERARAGYLGTAYRALTSYLGGLKGYLRSVFSPTLLAWPGVAANLFVRRHPSDYAAASVAEWQGRLAALDPELRGRLIERLAPIHGWFDRLATYYADRHRSGFTCVFSLAWMAAVAAVVGLIAEVEHWDIAWLWGWIELAVIGAILGLTLWGKYRRFHERWIDYRLLAEQVRHLVFLWPLGIAGPNARLSANPWSNDPRVRWTGWYYRALVRQLGFGATAVSAQHLAACRVLLRDLEIQDQRRYHDGNAERLEYLAHVVHRRTEVLFGAALVIALFHVLHPGGDPQIAAGLTVLSVFLPARAAALHGWAGHADFHAGAIRSRETELRLEQLERSIDRVLEISTETLGPLALASARTMESELGSWRATSQSRPLERV